MTNIADLNLRQEILPLFDFTFNDDTRESLFKMLQKPLASVAEIESRQDVIRGFIENDHILQGYSYARPDFHEVHRFVTDNSIRNYERGLRWTFLFNKKERHKINPKFIQLVVLFNRLQVFFFERIAPSAFPPEYRAEILYMNDFLASFNLKYYDELITERTFKTKHIAALAKAITEKQRTGAIDSFYTKLILFETYLSISMATIRHSFCFPSFTGGSLAVRDLYHPLLKTPVKNSFRIKNNVILLTGPNMSGKSTFLKSLGLCVYLAQVGVSVPAVGAELPYFEHIAISINHNDDLQNGHSHFMAEILRLKEVLVQASNGKRCFAIFDELFKGTNIDDAVQISSTTISGMTKYNNSVFFISTHLHQLKNVKAVQDKQVDTYYLDCQIDGDKPVFNYKLKEGWSDLKIGQLLFEIEGLNGLLQTTHEEQSLPDHFVL